MLSVYRENILILSEHVQILEQIFDSEVIRNYLYLIHDIQSLIVTLNNLSYIHHFVGIFEKNQHSFHDDNNNELLDAIIFSVCLHISQPGNVFQKITHR